MNHRDPAMTNFMLQPLFDNRSGERPEIVLLVFNEVNRIEGLLDYYGGRFDLVFLDGGSTDGTLELAQRAGASAYRRRGPEWVGENHFVHYVNHVTLSGRCFYLFADEFVARDELFALMEGMARDNTVIYGQRTDWFYGKQSRLRLRPSPRGLNRGQAKYIPDTLHESLGVEGEPSSTALIDVHHFHVWRMDRYFGQAGAYAFTETTRYLDSPAPGRKFARRFLVSEIALLPRHLWRIRGGGLALYAWRAVLSLAVTLIGVLCWIEIKYLLSAEEQAKFYAQKYRE
jgi:glycosyltransferase involved in cell wall biosynthesis